MNNSSNETMNCDFQRTQEIITQTLREEMPFLSDGFCNCVVDKIVAQLKLENSVAISEDVKRATALEYVKDYNILGEMVRCSLRYLNGIPRGEVSEKQRKIDESLIQRIRDVGGKYKNKTASECMVVTKLNFSALYDSYLRGELHDKGGKEGEN